MPGIDPSATSPAGRRTSWRSCDPKPQGRDGQGVLQINLHARQGNWVNVIGRPIILHGRLGGATSLGGGESCTFRWKYPCMQHGKKGGRIHDVAMFLYWAGLG